MGLCSEGQWENAMLSILGKQQFDVSGKALDRKSENLDAVLLLAVQTPESGFTTLGSSFHCCELSG